MMVVVANLRVGGFFEHIAEWIIARLHPHHLFPTVVFTTGLLSAFLVNDIVCLVMTPFVVHMAQRPLCPPMPYVIAVATASTPPAMAAAVGAALLLITRTVDPRKVYDEVDGGLLVFFVGLFIIVSGAERAGLTAALLDPIARFDIHDIARFVPITAVLSNVVSNVPAVVLLQNAFPDPRTGWLVLAMASTLAGNLTITGSIANIIVVERAVANGVHVGLRDHIRVGVPVTLVTLTLGSIWLSLTL